MLAGLLGNFESHALTGHRLLDRGLKQRDAVLVLYACCALAALCSLAVMNAHVAETAPASLPSR